MLDYYNDIDLMDCKDRIEHLLERYEDRYVTNDCWPVEIEEVRFYDIEYGKEFEDREWVYEQAREEENRCIIIVDCGCHSWMLLYIEDLDWISYPYDIQRVDKEEYHEHITSEPATDLMESKHWDDGAAATWDIDEHYYFDGEYDIYDVDDPEFISKVI